MSTIQADTPATGREADRRFAVERYQEGSSLREISIGLGRSYGYARRLLLEAGAALRPRGGPNRRGPAAPAHTTEETPS